MRQACEFILFQTHFLHLSHALLTLVLSLSSLLLLAGGEMRSLELASGDVWVAAAPALSASMELPLAGVHSGKGFIFCSLCTRELPSVSILELYQAIVVRVVGRRSQTCAGKTEKYGGQLAKFWPFTR